MSEAQEATVEPVANPYNMNKEYVQDDKPFESAEGIFYDKKQATSQEAPAENVDYKKRYDDLKKHYDSKVSEFKQKEQELQAEARMTQKVEQSVRHEDAVEAQEALAQEVETREPVIEDDRLQALDEREARIARREAELTLSSRHPDFEDIRKSEEFHAWAKSQPESIQDWIYNNPNDVDLAVKAIDLYKLENEVSTKVQEDAKQKSQTSAQASAADMVSTKTTSVDAQQPKIWTQREIAALSMAEYDKHEKEIDKAIMEGRVVN
jgi:hypothetical protein